jgi:DNA-binding response OmpR family regulator
MSKRVLLIDDEPGTTRMYAKMLLVKGYDVREENDSRQAETSAAAFRPDVIVLDFVMPTMHGADLAWLFSSRHDLAGVPLILVTGFPDAVSRSMLPPNQVQILAKPITAEALVAAIEACTPRSPS